MVLAHAREVHMDTGSIHRTLLLYAAPVLLTQLLQQLYNMADCAVVGHFGGAFGLAAVGVAGLIIAVHVNFFIGFSVGVSSITAKLFGARRYNDLRRAIATSLLLASVMGFLLTLASEWMGRAYLEWLSCPTEAMDDALVYLRICALGLIPQLIYNVANAILRSLGNTKTALLYLGVSVIVNLALDLVLAAVMGYGLAGAAWATLIAQWGLGIAMLWRLTQMDGEYSLTIHTDLLSPGELFALLKQGIPSGMQAAFMSLSSLMIQVYIDSFGPAAMAGMVIYAKIEGFLYYPAFAYGMALTGFVGQNLGAGRLDRVEEAVRISSRTAVVSTAMICAVLAMAARPLLSCFTNDAASLQNGLAAVYWTFPVYFLYSLNQVYIGGLKGLGDAQVPMLSALIGYALFRVAWCAVLLPVFHDMAVIYNAYNMSFLVTLALLVPSYRHRFRSITGEAVRNQEALA